MSGSISSPTTLVSALRERLLKADAEWRSARQDYRRALAQHGLTLRRGAIPALRRNRWFPVPTCFVVALVQRHGECPMRWPDVADEDRVTFSDAAGRLHRVDGPAVVDSYGTESWYWRGVWHRPDGPAYIEDDGNETWFVRGVQVDADQWRQFRDNYDPPRDIARWSVALRIAFEFEFGESRR